jgi:hypothetical protein
LAREGYAIEVRAGHLLVHDVPYVTSSGQVARGVLVSSLELTVIDGQEVTAPPGTHVIEFAGGVPCDASGARLDRLINADIDHDLGDGIRTRFSFSHKPVGSTGYPDYHAKIVAYVSMLGSYAAAVDPTVSACTFRIIEDHDDDSPFLYQDTASARAGIGAVSAKLALSAVAIVGVGGTGSHVLDLLAKTHVRVIHVFDADHFRVHNAFRAPGATSMADLEGGPNKAEHFASVYGRMRKPGRVIAHPHDIDLSNLELLAGMDAVFLATDPFPDKHAVIVWLERQSIPFFDTGIGIDLHEDALSGQVRLTSGLPGRPVSDRPWIPTRPVGDDAVYGANIQVVELNALAAAWAVLRWKRHLGFYFDDQDEQHSLFTISGNTIDDDLA